MMPDQTKDGQTGAEDKPRIPNNLPILPIKEAVVYPEIVAPLVVATPRGIKLIDDAVMGDRMVVLVATKSGEIEDPGQNDIHTMGTAAVIHRFMKSPDGSVRLIAQGLERIRIDNITQTEPYMRADITQLPDQDEKDLTVEALMRNTMDMFRRMVNLTSGLPEDLVNDAQNVERPKQLVYLIGWVLRFKLPDKQELLELDPVEAKLKKLNQLLSQELEVLELGKKLQSETQSTMEKTQREYYLREQLRAIQKELGEEDEQAVEAKDLEEKVKQAGMPPEADKEARRELSRLRMMPPQAAEYSLIKTYLEWMVELPWNKVTEDNLDIVRARQILDEDHYDLEKIKDRIVEYLAVRKLKKERGDGDHDKGPILCFVGPPGTGKTSLGQSIARAMGRKFIRMSLGGVRDEAEIRGFRRTYVGSVPGRIIQAIRRAESRNPVFMMDEVDKIGADFRGDPSSALLEVLDPEQNKDFRDHYLEVPFDLSQVVFITTANVLDTIPGPLRDRMEIIQLSGYTEAEKVQIAERYLIPRQMKENGLKEGEITFSSNALLQVIRDYTREAGLRNLEREIGAICRKAAIKIADASATAIQVNADDIAGYLGKPRFFADVAERTETPGVATGLAWTPVGGDILFIEATRMKGSKGLLITGQLGDVMKESAQAALSLVRSRAKSLGIPEDFFDKSDIHIHVPEGATPKDGPSAGITMTTALVSALTGRPVKSNVAMTGEITLRGRVLPIGGLKEKVLAANRAGITTVIIPRHNEKDLDDIPPELRKGMTFVPVDTIDDVLPVALRDGKKPTPDEPDIKPEAIPVAEPA
jgi:ATP-dependent Lon protease